MQKIIYIKNSNCLPMLIIIIYLKSCNYLQIISVS